jgi:hypothetical protein
MRAGTAPQTQEPIKIEPFPVFTSVESVESVEVREEIESLENSSFMV